MVGLHGTSKDIELDGEKTSLMQIEPFISTFWGPAGNVNHRFLKASTGSRFLGNIEDEVLSKLVLAVLIGDALPCSH